MAVGLFEEVLHALSCNFFQHCSILRENFIDFCQSFCGRVVKKAFYNFRLTFSQIVFWRKKNISTFFDLWEKSFLKSAKKLCQGWKSCILRLQWIILKRSFVFLKKKSILLSVLHNGGKLRPFKKLRYIGQVCQKCIPFD